MLRLGHRARKVEYILHVSMLVERNRRTGLSEAAQASVRTTAMVGHRAESIYRRYAIADAKATKEAARKPANLHEQQRDAPRKVAAHREAQQSPLRKVWAKSPEEGARELVARDGIDPPTRGFSEHPGPPDQRRPTTTNETSAG
jgi:hypothetical protein